MQNRVSHLVPVLMAVAFLLRRVSGFSSQATFRHHAGRRTFVVASALPDKDQRPSDSLRFEQSLLKDLNPSQIQAITQPLNSITRVIAGPGSGKTRVLTSRIAYILNTDRRNNVLALTFTKKAASEMERRVFEIIGEPTPRVNLGTFHSVCTRMLRYNGDHLSSLPSVVADMSKSMNETLLDGGFTIMDQADQLRIAKEILTARNIDLKNMKDVKPLTIVNAMGRIKEKLAAGNNPFDSKEAESIAMKFAKAIYFDFREQLLSNNSLDFDDLIYLARELLMNNQDVRQRLQSFWTHILVDEFQDTSVSQMDIIKLLSTDSLLVVGDADQSIYSWRGAQPTSLTDFGKQFNTVETVHLMENYRSTANIVKAAQMVISNSGQLSGADKLRQEMIPKRGTGVAPRIIACADGKTEADFIVKKVMKMIASGEYGVDHTVAFIYRTNAQSRPLEEACVQFNLPYVVFGSATSFYKRQEVKDCLCYLRFLYNGRDKEAFLRAVKTPRRGIGESALLEFGEYYDKLLEERSISLYDALQTLLVESEADDRLLPSEFVSKRPLKALQAFAQQLGRFRSFAASGTVEDLLARIIDDVQLLAHLDKTSKSAEECEDRTMNVRELQQATRKYSNEGPALSEQASQGDMFGQSPLGHFLDDVALITDIADNSLNSNEEKRVTASLMTIHASKGMEFDSVFFVGIEDGTIPTSQAVNAGPDSIVFEEEKRLCYVAMTRAKSELVMSWRKEASIFTGEGMIHVKKQRSRFLDALAPRSTHKESNGADNDLSLTKGRYAHPNKKNRRPAWVANASRSYATKRSAPAAQLHAPSKHIQSFQGTSRVYADRTMTSRLESSQTMKKEHTLRKRVVQNAAKRKPDSFATAKQIAPRELEPSWIFPVGSTVVHQTRGKGTVLPSAGKMEVSVQFSNGETLDFPLNGSEIMPSFP